MSGAKFLKCFGRKKECSSMDPSMYKAATSGDVGFLQAIRVGEASTDLLSQKTPIGNNILHLAAEFKQVSFFKDVPSFVEGFPLVWGINRMKDTPLHIAARVGCVELVEFLIDRAKILHVQKAGDQEKGPTYAGSYKKLLRKTNLKMHTALHIAAQYGHLGVVISLMKADPELCCSTNSAKESPLFLATCKGYYKIAAEILKEPSVCPSFQGIYGVTALHVAVSHTNQEAEEIVNSMVSKCPDMKKKADALGWAPLHYAAFGGNLTAVTLLLMKSDESRTSYILDKHGMTALHVAAYKGHVEVMKKLLQIQPDTCECLNAKDQTILHVAVLGAQNDVVKYILEQAELSRFIDQADEEGYTPLQLAVMVQKTQNHEITRMLTLDCGVDNEGLSLVFDNFRGEDIKKQVEVIKKQVEDIEKQVPEKNKLKEQLQKMKTEEESIHHLGRSFGVPSFHEQISRDFKKFESILDEKDSGKPEGVAGKPEIKKSDVNLLIATLIATVTFTAALAPPGGFGDNGKAILRDNTSFRWFQQFNLLSFFFALAVLFYEAIVASLGVLHPRISKDLLLLVKQFKPGTLVLSSLYGMCVALVAGASASLDRKQKLTSADIPIMVVSFVSMFIIMAPDMLQARNARLGKKSADSGGAKFRRILSFVSK